MTSGAGTELEGLRVLLGVSGGIAAYKSAFLARLLSGAGAAAMERLRGAFASRLTL